MSVLTRRSGSTPRTWSDGLAQRLPELRQRLRGERQFRIQQLSEPPAAASGRHRQPTVDAGERARREVRTAVAAGARQALADIELALARIRTGEYGLCTSCAKRIPLAVLSAIPQTNLCLACRCGPEPTATPANRAVRDHPPRRCRVGEPRLGRRHHSNGIAPRPPTMKR